jgi:hypothetical protein
MQAQSMATQAQQQGVEQGLQQQVQAQDQMAQQQQAAQEQQVGMEQMAHQQEMEKIAVKEGAKNEREVAKLAVQSQENLPPQQ